MSDWTPESELENAQQKVEEFSQKAKKAIEDGDQSLAEQLQWWVDVWQVKVRTWETIIKNQAFKSPPSDFEKIRELQTKNMESLQSIQLPDSEKLRQDNAEFAEKMREFNERIAAWKKKNEEDQAKRKKKHDEDQPPQEPEQG
jgi:hypothetical protein